MKNWFLALACILATLIVRSQDYVIVKDSILQVRMESGYADRHFKPKGAFENGEKTGFWKDYEVSFDRVFLQGTEAPEELTAHYLQYGEGLYENDERHGTWKIYFVEDKSRRKILFKEVSYVHGVREDSCTYYYPDGSKAACVNYRHGKYDGKMTIYYPDGAVCETRTYDRNQRSGDFIGYYPDGKIKMLKQYVNDSLNGFCRRYYPNGQLKEELTYKQDAEDGLNRYYYKSGQLWIERVFEGGKLMQITGSYRETGEPLDFGTFENGNGTVIYYTTEGKPYTEIQYRDGEKISEEQTEEFK